MPTQVQGRVELGWLLWWVEVRLAVPLTGRPADPARLVPGNWRRQFLVKPYWASSPNSRSAGGGWVQASQTLRCHHHTILLLSSQSKNLHLWIVDRMRAYKRASVQASSESLSDSSSSSRLLVLLRPAHLPAAGLPDAPAVKSVQSRWFFVSINPPCPPFFCKQFLEILERNWFNDAASNPEQQMFSKNLNLVSCFMEN